jgi:predicted Zn-dependent protease
MIEKPATPWNEAEFRDIADRVLKASKAEGTEVVINGSTDHLTRFANSQIHQNVSEQNLEVSIRLAFGQKVGMATTNDLSPEGIERAVRNAEQLAKYQPANPEFPGFANPQHVERVNATSDRTLGFTPGDRAGVVQHVCRDALKENVAASGAFATGLKQVAVANSNGVWAYHQHSLADFNTVVMSDDSSGWAQATHLDAGRIDGEALAEEAIDKALRSRKPQSLEPGSYTVVLEPYAVLELLQYLGYGLGAEEVEEGRSFMTGHHGEKLVHKDISVWDDGLDPTGIPFPFDYEGTPKQKVMILDRGRVGGPVYDLRTALKEGRTSTGHCAGASKFWGAGAQASNLFMSPGVHRLDEMIESTERGVYVTRFHYVNRLDPKKTMVTGMTRDGTFWIENGKIVRPLQNMRFTHPILEALRDVEMIGMDSKLETNWWGGGNRAPALKIKNFRFSGKTNF